MNLFLGGNPEEKIEGLFILIQEDENMSLKNNTYASNWNNNM